MSGENNLVVDELERAWPSAGWQEHRTLIAVSGGADSVALVRAMHAIIGTKTDVLQLAHFNHGWRGEASDADAAFVVRLAAELDLKIHVGEASQRSSESNFGQGAEAIAREARYDFLVEKAEQIGARYIVTAHTLDDQVETILHRILRGTGIAGLRGIEQFRTLTESITLARPMLTVSREQVIQYLGQINQEFCHDASNADITFTRNKIRLKVLPFLTEHFGEHVSRNLLKLSSQAVAIQDVIESQIKPIVEKDVEYSIEKGRECISIKTDKLRTQPVHLVCELLKHLWSEQNWPLRDMTFEHWRELAEFVQIETPPSKKAIYPGNVVVQRDANRMRLSCEAK